MRFSAIALSFTLFSILCYSHLVSCDDSTTPGCNLYSLSSAEGATLNLTCPSPLVIVNIPSAAFGNKDASCALSNAAAIFKSQALKQPFLLFMARPATTSGGTNWLPDPCDGVTKTLNITWCCGLPRSIPRSIPHSSSLSSPSQLHVPSQIDRRILRSGHGSGNNLPLDIKILIILGIMICTAVLFAACMLSDYLFGTRIMESRAQYDQRRQEEERREITGLSSQHQAVQMSEAVQRNHETQPLIMRGPEGVMVNSTMPQEPYAVVTPLPVP